MLPKEISVKSGLLRVFLDSVRACLHGGRVPRLTGLPGGGGANFSYVSFENASKRLHGRQGSPPAQGTLRESTCPRHPARGVDKTWGRPWPRPWRRPWRRPWPTLWPTLWPTGGQI